MIKSLNSPKNMSAQYRPYRNEDGTECDQANWNDQELGDVEIYQKTTEDIRVISNRNLIVAGIGIGILGALLGLVIGYFAHSEHTECVASLAVAIHSVKDENPYIRKKILEIVSAEHIEKYIKAFSTESHVAGSAADKHFARTVETEWKESGLDKTEIVEYKVLLSEPDLQRPNNIKVMNSEMDTIFSIEAAPKRGAPAFSAYSLPGNVSGDLVFVNHARLSDFKHLNKVLGIDLEGKILIAKQSNLSADKQAWNAQLVKAAGLILYPDPKEYHPPIFKTKPFPNSWWLPENVARTDTVFWNGVGDPLTPGYPARIDANRLSISSATLPQIIVQPITYSDAFKLLSSLGGAEAPDTWQGGFNFTYKVGPVFKDPTWKVHMQSYNKYVNKTIYNVIGTLIGRTEPDRYVLIGSHRDAWGSGALDAASGTASVLELTRVFGHLLKLSWRPRRTIIFCSWGAEEYNLIGSTEWLEENLKILQGRAVAYINADMPVSGNSSVDVSASPLLYNAIYNATKEVMNPNEQEREEGLKTVYDAWLVTFPQKRNSTKLLYPEHAGTFPIEELEDHMVFKRNANNRTNLLHSYMKNAMQAIRPRVRRMDVKSNYAPFYVYAGIPAIDVAYVHDVKTPEVPYPLYHTEHDTFSLIKNFVDPTFKYHATVTKILGEVLRDLSDSLFLPFNLFDYAQVLQNFYRELSADYKDIFKDFGLDLIYLERAVKNFTEAAFKFHSTQESADLSDPMTIRRINDQLLLLERAFLDHHGLPHNPFKKHIVMSPSESGPQNTFPGLIDELGSIRYNIRDPESLKTIKVHFSALVFTIQSAAKTISDV